MSTRSGAPYLAPPLEQSSTNLSSQAPNHDPLEDSSSILSPQLMGVTPADEILSSSRPSSRASLYVERDIETIYTEFCQIRGQELADLSTSQLDSSFRSVELLISELQVILNENPDLIGTAFDCSISLKELLETLTTLRFGPFESSRPEFSLPPNFNEIDFTNEVHCFIGALEDTMIQTVTKRIAREYSKYSLYCTSSNLELKRKVHALQRNLNTIFLSKQDLDTQVAHLSRDFITLKGSLSNLSTDFASLSSSTPSPSLSEKLDTLTTALVSLTARVSKIEQSSSLTGLHSQLDDVLKRVASLETLQLNSDSASVLRTSRITPQLFNDNIGQTSPQTISIPKSTSPVGASGLPSNPSVDLNRTLPLAGLNSAGRDDDQESLISSSSQSQSRLYQRLKEKANVNIALANKITSKDIANASKAETIEILNISLKRIACVKTELGSLTQQLSALDSPDENLLDLIESALISIFKWEDTVDDLQRKHYLHLSAEKSLLKKVDLKRFSGDVEGDTIYEFLSTFNNQTDSHCSPADKATLLYSTYLGDDIRKEVEAFKSSFQDMSNFLIGRYGDVRKT